MVHRKLGEIDARSLAAVMIVAGDKNEVSKLRIRTVSLLNFATYILFLQTMPMAPDCRMRRGGGR